MAGGRAGRTFAVAKNCRIAPFVFAGLQRYLCTPLFAPFSQ